MPALVMSPRRANVSDYGVAALDSALEMFEKIVFTPEPVDVTTATHTRAMSATSNAYSSRS
jgi:hypothetical protein